MLKGKTILVTGSARPNGIGFATAKLAKEYGATPILHGKDDDETIKLLSSELGCDYIVCDIGDQKTVVEAVNKVLTKVGRIDVLVNNAGKAFSETFLEDEDDMWVETLKSNLLGVVHFCQAVIPHMKKNNYGRIVNIASNRGHAVMASNKRMGYSAIKASIINLTASLAKEYAPEISVNCMSPGFTATDMSDLWTEKTKQQAQTSLLERIAKPSEIAEAILFLASDKASFITGQTLLVDGGYTMSGK